MANGKAKVAPDHVAAEQLPCRMVRGGYDAVLDNQGGLFDRFEDRERKGVAVGHVANPNRPAQVALGHVAMHSPMVSKGPDRQDQEDWIAPELERGTISPRQKVLVDAFENMAERSGKLEAGNP